MHSGHDFGDGLPTVTCPDRAAWRAWLERHHAEAPGAWLVYFKKHTGLPSVGYRDSVLEALCFGWIDGLKRRIDDQRYVHRFTPRRPGSRWSDLNVRCARELIAAGLMHAAGLEAFERRSDAPDPNAALRRDPEPALPADIEQALREHPQSWAHFVALAPGCRRQYVLWLSTAKRPETRRKRLEEAIRLLADGRSLGMK